MNAYRPEIDGLRAVAVLSVLLFHLGVAQFSGGYVGVDVFFVISGYLITQLIRTDVEAGTFTFRSFYIRRARRLFPALFFTLVLSLVGAGLLFSPAHLRNFSASLISAIVSLSNVQFWRESGYFNLDAVVKPLLHTWSLGIEEQFYLVWPALLWALLRRSAAAAIAAIALAGIVSFALNLVALRWYAASPATIFYLLPFRIFEFAIGAGVVWARPVRSAGLTEGLALLGLALILWPVLTYTEKTEFPSYNALAPCIGTALVIYAGGASAAGWLLRNPLAVGIGLISYSLYLIHWPLIVFWRYTTMQPLAPAEQTAIAAISLAAAILMHRFVETPFRRPAAGRSNARFIAAAVGASLATLVAATALFVSDGWPSRVPDDRRVYLAEKPDCGAPLPDSPLVSCSADRHAGKTIFVWGDSHARVLISGLAAAYPDYNVNILSFDGCPPQSWNVLEPAPEDMPPCGHFVRNALKFLLEQPPADVILHYSFGIDEAANIGLANVTRRIMDRIAAAGHHVVLLGDVIRPSIYLQDCYAVPATISDHRLETRCDGNVKIAAALATQNSRLKAWHGADRFVDPSAAFFDNGKYRPRIGRHLLFEDTNHLTPFGSRHMIDLLKPDMKIGEHRFSGAFNSTEGSRPSD